MRVTANTFSNVLVNQLSGLAQRQNQLQAQAATGQRVRFPDDDPASVHRVLDLQVEGRNEGQYQRNLGDLKDLSTMSYASMRSVKGLLDRAREIATNADGTKSPDELKIYATEVNQLLKDAVEYMNTKHNGDYLFSGTISDQAPFAMTVDSNEQVTSVTYQGNQGIRAIEVSPGVTMNAQVLGANSTGTGPRGLISDPRSGADLFNHLIALRDNLLNKNTTGVQSTDLGNLAKDEDNFLIHFGLTGAIQQQIDATTELSKKRSFSLEQTISNEVDVDLSLTIVRLNQTQTAYSAALQSGAKIMSQNLLDYLH